MPTSPSYHRYDLRAVVADVSSAVVVFLVALPLCLGIALASNAPLFSGILAGIVGGIVVGALSGSHTSVSGPAAGLTAVVIVQLAALGSFEAFLLAIVLAGILQIVLGAIRAGSIADFVPSSVIKGLLAAIGLILILKQIPHLVGHDTDPTGEMSFHQPDQETTFSELGATLFDIHPAAALIGLISLLMLVGWKRIRFLKRSPLPAALVVVLTAVALNILFGRIGGLWIIHDSHLVQVPIADSLAGFIGFLRLPDFTQLANPQLLLAAITIAAVASLETLLNLEAVDKLDPQKRVSPPNRELIAQGCGNVVSGLIGGLPITSVIVRSSVNVNSGGRSKLSAILHGTLLLLCVVFLPTWLNRIPLSCLAAVLIITGFKLASPKVFKQMWRSGANQFLPFIITVTAILMTDLLVGILIGLGISIVFILRSNLRRPLRQIREHHIGGEVTRIELANQVSFLNRAALSRALNKVPPNGHVLVDARNTDYIDADVLDLITEYERETAPVRGVQVSLLGFKNHYEQLEDRVQYVDYATRELQADLTSDQILQILRQGNERYRTGQSLTRDLGRQRAAAVNGQHPLAVVLSGSSSRTPIEIIFDVGVGDLFCVRATGNFAGDGVLGSLEYATMMAGARLIVVLGHTRNNAVRLIIESCIEQKSTAWNSDCPYLESILAEVRESIDSRKLEQWPQWTLGQRYDYVDEVSRAHVRRTMDKIVDSSECIRRLIQQGKVDVVGGMYDVENGEVAFLDSLGANKQELTLGSPQTVGNS